MLDDALPEDKLMSLEISLLHLRIEARSEALREDSSPSLVDIRTCSGAATVGPVVPTAGGSVCTPTSVEKMDLFSGCCDRVPMEAVR